MKRSYLFSLIFLFLAGCCQDPEPPGLVEGLRPIYLSADNLDIFSIQAAQPYEAPTAFTYHNETIIAMELYTGLHLIDNSDPTLPVQTSFMSIPGVVNFATHQDFLYVDNAKDLLVFDISDLNALTLLTKVADIYTGTNTSRFPSDTDVFFECVDPALGVVVGWERAELDSPRCRR